jgi:hypothetical protein
MSTTAVKVTADAEVSGSNQRVVGVAVTKTSAGDRLDLKDGGSGGTIKAAIDADVGGYIPLEIEFNTDVYADVTGTTAIYLVIYR